MPPPNDRIAPAEPALGAERLVRVGEIDGILERIAALSESELSRAWVFRGRTLDVRNAAYWALVEAQEVLTRLHASGVPESRRILALAQRAFGDLRGLLLGLPDDLLDRAP